MTPNMKSNILFDGTVFDPASVSADTNAFKEYLMDVSTKGPKWYEVVAANFRRMRYEGKTHFPMPVLLESASTVHIPSRDPDRTIPCRILRPQNNQALKGLFMHIHGGGWVLSDEKSLDETLQWYADTADILAISIGYRLAPEYPFPAGPDDCYDAAEWLVANAEAEFGAPLSFIGGESAGGHLTMLTTLHLLQHFNSKVSSFSLKGIILHYGVYNLLYSPSVVLFHKPKTLVLDRDIMLEYAKASIPDMSLEERRDANLSPLYADLERLRGKSPPALFTCGTEDMLVDDTVFMSSKWMMAGGETIVKIVPGACHGYTYYPRDAKGATSAQGLDATVDFMKTKLI